jgi:ketosteroid isomerase-like protein
MDMGIEEEELRFHELRVRTFPGDVAIVHGHYYAHVLRGTGAELSPRLLEIYGRGATMRFTAVWQKQDGRWRALAHQATEEQ